jgi:hypothetical protein
VDPHAVTCTAVQEARAADMVELAISLAEAVLVAPLFDGGSASARQLHMCAMAAASASLKLALKRCRA